MRYIWMLKRTVENFVFIFTKRLISVVVLSQLWLITSSGM